MEGNPLVITIKELIDSTTQLAEYIDELGCVLVHMAKQMKNEWKVVVRTYG
jgi:RNAse (barnase) inhibitor barstar